MQPHVRKQFSLLPRIFLQREASQPGSQDICQSKAVCWSDKKTSFSSNCSAARRKEVLDIFVWDFRWNENCPKLPKRFYMLPVIGDFPIIHLGDLPPLKIWQNSLYWYLSANLSGGYKFYNKTVSFVSGGPYGPKGEPPLVIIMVFILVFICQPFGRVLIL